MLSLTPTLVKGKYYDNALCWQCVVGPWLYPNQTVPELPSPPNDTTSSSQPKSEGASWHNDLVPRKVQVVAAWSILSVAL